VIANILLDGVESKEVRNLKVPRSKKRKKAAQAAAEG